MSHRLVFLHGFTGHPGAFVPVAEHLPNAVRANVIAPALVGHGAAAPESTTFAEEVDRLWRAVRDVTRDPVHLVGYSMGARLALGMMVARPTGVARATLIGVNPGIDRETERDARASADERWARLLETRGTRAFVEKWEAQPIFATQRRLDETIRARQRRERSRHDSHGLARALRVVGLGAMPSFTADLSRLEIPVRLAAGGLDEKFTKVAGTMLATLRRASVELVPDAGHNLVLEAPRAVAEIIRKEPA